LEILITLCGRGGSKGIPGKNIKPLAGKPLIEYTIEIAQDFASEYGAKIALSTDDNDIKLAASKVGLVTKYDRPAQLATDKAGKIDTIRDLVQYEEGLTNIRYDYILDLDLTSPLRTKLDLISAFELIQNDHNALTLFSVNPAARNPYFNMVEAKRTGYYDLIKKSEDGTVMSRQKAPTVYDLNASFYWYRRSFFDLELKSPITDKSLVFVMDHICFDLDHPIDFEFLSYLIEQKKVDFI
jgi:CMP-N,N'-diacetyllegionaminic acid synthase